MEIENLLEQIQPAWEKQSYEDIKQQLNKQVAYLIDHDFERLVRLLYTIDVDERVLKHLLQQQVDRPSSDIITDLIIERQIEKLKLRQRPNNNDPATDEERW